MYSRMYMKDKREALDNFLKNMGVEVQYFRDQIIDAIPPYAVEMSGAEIKNQKEIRERVERSFGSYINAEAAENEQKPMTKEDIMAIKDHLKRRKAIEEHKELFM